MNYSMYNCGGGYKHSTTGQVVAVKTKLVDDIWQCNTAVK